jgi:hypothetical protein
MSQQVVHNKHCALRGQQLISKPKAHKLFTHCYGLIGTISISTVHVTYTRSSSIALIYVTFYSDVCAIPGKHFYVLLTFFRCEPHTISHVTAAVTQTINTSCKILLVYSKHNQNSLWSLK